MRDVDIIYKREASELCKVSFSELEKWHKSGKLKYENHPLSGDTIYSRKKLENFLGVRASSFLPKPSKKEMIRGARMSFANSCILLEDSRALLSRGSYGTAFSICAIALEELGKAINCLNPISEMNKNKFDWKAFWDDFYSHSSKTQTIHLYLYAGIMLGKLSPLEIIKIFKDMSKIPKKTKYIDMQKQNGFYVDFLKSPEKMWFETPRKMVKKEDAEWLIDFSQKIITLIKKQKLFNDECIKRICQPPFFIKIIKKLGGF